LGRKSFSKKGFCKKNSCVAKFHGMASAQPAPQAGP
jgi:hypothetical protein